MSNCFSLPPGLICGFYPAVSSRSGGEYDDFYRYSSGRWLWNEEAQLQDRYKRFNVPELKQVAARSTGAQRCVLMTKLAEGGFNKVFRLVMDNGSVVIARIPNPNFGPLFKATASKVATMDFVRLSCCIVEMTGLIYHISQALTVLGIPVPKVLTWSADGDNPVQSEYILMEEGAGTQLGELWDAIELESKLKIVEDVVAIETKFLSLSFTRYVF